MKSIQALPRVCNDEWAVSKPQDVRADCIAYKYVRRCQGQRFFNDPICTNLGYQRPGFAFASINKYCSSVPGLPQCNDWMNYIQMIANGPKVDSKVVSAARAETMGAEHYNEENERIALKEFWYRDSDSSTSAGYTCNKDIDFTVGGRVLSNAVGNYNPNVTQDVFYPVEYDKKMRQLCNVNTGKSFGAESQSPDEVWGCVNMPLGTVMSSVFGQNQYQQIPKDSLGTVGAIPISLKHLFSLPDSASNEEDAVHLIKEDMSEDQTLPVLKRGVDFDISSDRGTLTLRLKSDVEKQLKNGTLFLMVRHGGAKGCRCIRMPSTVSLASDGREPYRKECVYGFCDTTMVSELRVAANDTKSVVHYPRRDYLSARDGTLVPSLNGMSTTGRGGTCPSKMTICETNLSAGKSIIIDKQSRIVNECGSGSSGKSTSSPSSASTSLPADQATPSASSPISTDPISTTTTTTTTKPSSAAPPSPSKPAGATSTATTNAPLSLQNMTKKEKQQLMFSGLSTSAVLCSCLLMMFGVVAASKRR